MRNLFGLPIAALTMDGVVELCRGRVGSGAELMIGVVNAAKVVKMRRDGGLRSAVLGSDLILADGMSVVWASRLLGRPLPERVAGIDLFERLVGEAEEGGRSIYLLGATDQVLRGLLAHLRARHPRLRVAGARNGYFGGEDEPEVAAEIRRSGADFLFVGMPTPRKERFLARFGRSLGVRLCHGVGGSFDVLAGKVKRAPLAWQRLGVEWLYRVLQEPRRLWRRYLVTNCAFVALVLKERFVPTPLARAAVRGALVPVSRRPDPSEVELSRR